MAQKNNAAAAAKKVAEQKAPTENNQKQTVNVVQLNDLDKLARKTAATGMSPDRTVVLLDLLTERFYRDPNAAKKMKMAQETVDKINEVTGVAIVAAFATEVAIAETPFAVTMRAAQLDTIKEIAASLNININTKMLPAPAEDGTVTVPSTAVEMTDETKKALKEEHAAATKTVKNSPADIENEDQLKEAILQILVKGNGSAVFYDKVITAINFYRSYLDIQAEKATDKAAEHAKIKGYSNADLLAGIAKLLGRCTFTTSGMAKFLFESVQKSKSPVSAFCMFRTASLNNKTGRPQIDDQLVADITRVLVMWYISSEKEKYNERIAGIKKDLEVLKKDEKKNKKAIDDSTGRIKLIEANIEQLNIIESYMTAPTREFADNFPAVYVDNKAEGFKAAHMTGSKILESYYPEIELKKVDQDSLVHVLQQYCGVITNMFLSPLEQISDYNEALIGELVFKEDEPKKALRPMQKVSSTMSLTAL